MNGSLQQEMTYRKILLWIGIAESLLILMRKMLEMAIINLELNIMGSEGKCLVKLQWLQRTTIKDLFNFIVHEKILYNICICNFVKFCEQHNISNYETPNFIFILADDLGYGEIGIQGQKWIETPNIVN